MRKNYIYIIVTIIAACVLTSSLTVSCARRQDTPLFEPSATEQAAAESDAPEAPASEDEEPTAYELYQKMNEIMRDKTRVEVRAFYEVSPGSEHGDDAGSAYGTFTIRQIQRSDMDIDMEMDGSVKFEDGVKEMLNYYSAGEYSFKDKSQTQRFGVAMHVTAIPLQPVNPRFEENAVISSLVEKTPEGTRLTFYLSDDEIYETMQRINRGTLIGVDALKYFNDNKYDYENIKYEVYLDEHHRPSKCTLDYETSIHYYLDPDDATTKVSCRVRLDSIRYDTFDSIAFPYEVGVNDPASIL